MGRTFFTADTHFGHERMIVSSNRPFSSVAEMDEKIIEAWNSVVEEGDTVWHVGDFAHRSSRSRMSQIFRRLKGMKHLIRGNHDGREALSLGWKSISDIREIDVSGHRVVLCHYPMREWPAYFNGALHFFGHCHARMPGSRRSLDVGVDSVGFEPRQLSDLKAIMAQLPELSFREGEPAVLPADQALE